MAFSFFDMACIAKAISFQLARPKKELISGIQVFNLGFLLQMFSLFQSIVIKQLREKTQEKIRLLT